MTTNLYIDFETRSDVELKTAGLWNYVNGHNTGVWCMAYAFDDEPVHLWVPSDKGLPKRVQQHVELGGTVVAHNAEFELAVWNQICYPRYDWPMLSARQTICTMAACHAMSLPGALKDAALALGLKMQKDDDGRALMLRMARPKSLSPITWWDDGDRRVALFEYCRQDVRVEREIHKRVMPLGTTERAVWAATHAINMNGIPFDEETVLAAALMAINVGEDADRRLASMTDGAVTSVNALLAMKSWIKDREGGKEVASLSKSAIEEMLLNKHMSNVVRNVLTLRQEAGKSSTAKLRSIIKRMDHQGIVRHGYTYHGAGTGRWSGRGVQPHNMTRDVPDATTVTHVTQLIRMGDFEGIGRAYGPVLTMLSRCIRPMIQAPEGYRLVGGDWSNVEGRGVAWFCGEEWKLKVFRDADAGKGPGVYETMAAAIFGVPVEQVTKEQRQAGGKVPELAFGFGGGVGAFQGMAKNFGVKVSNEKAEAFKQAWRAKHLKVVDTWRALSDAAIMATKFEGQPFDVGVPGRHVTYKRVGSFLWCLLPSGRAICYPYPKVLQGMYGPQLTYMTVPGQDKSSVIADPANAPNWSRVGAHGGLLLENIVQGFCSDFLRHVMLACQNIYDYPVVVHTHDDLYCLVPDYGAGRVVRTIQMLMNTPPAWAQGFPLVAEVHTTKRYGLVV